MPYRRGNIDERRGSEGAGGSAFDACFAAPPQHHQRLFILSRRMPANCFARLQPHEAAAHSGRLRDTPKQRAISPRAFEGQSQRLGFGCLGREGQQGKGEHNQGRSKNSWCDPFHKWSPSSPALVCRECSVRGELPLARPRTDRCCFCPEGFPWLVQTESRPWHKRRALSPHCPERWPSCSVR